MRAEAQVRGGGVAEHAVTHGRAGGRGAEKDGPVHLDTATFLSWMAAGDLLRRAAGGSTL